MQDIQNYGQPYQKALAPDHAMAMFGGWPPSNNPPRIDDPKSLKLACTWGGGDGPVTPDPSGDSIGCKAPAARLSRELMLTWLHQTRRLWPPAGRSKGKWRPRSFDFLPPMAAFISLMLTRRRSRLRT